MGRAVGITLATVIGAVLGAFLAVMLFDRLPDGTGLAGVAGMLVALSFAGAWCLGAVAEAAMRSATIRPSGSGAVMAPGRWGFWVAAVCAVLAPIGFATWMYVAFACGGG